MDKSQKKKAAASAVAAVTAASVLVGGAFSTPADIMDNGPDALIQSMDMDMDSQNDAGDGSDDGAEDESRGRVKSALRRFVHQTPAAVRACVVLPLWLLGTLFAELGAVLWGAVLSPVFAAVLDWLAVALMAIIIFALAAKTIAPDLPLRKILNKKTVPGIIALCLGFGLLDALLPLVWEGYELLARWLRFGGSMICTAVPVCFFLRRHKAARTKAEERELSYEQQEAAARRLVEELADSVCRPR